MDLSEAPFGPAVARIQRLILWLAAAGCLLALASAGFPGLLGFAAGAAAAGLNFRWLKQIVEALGNPARRPRTRLALWLGFRYLLLGIGGYAILSFSELSLRAALAGLFVPVAAVLLEILFELAYARS